MYGDVCRLDDCWRADTPKVSTCRPTLRLVGIFVCVHKIYVYMVADRPIYDSWDGVAKVLVSAVFIIKHFTSQKSS